MSRELCKKCKIYYRSPTSDMCATCSREKDVKKRNREITKERLKHDKDKKARLRPSKKIRLRNWLLYTKKEHGGDKWWHKTKQIHRIIQMMFDTRNTAPPDEVIEMKKQGDLQCYFPDECSSKYCDCRKCWHTTQGIYNLPTMTINVIINDKR